MYKHQVNKYRLGDKVTTRNIQNQDEVCHDGMVGFINEILDVDDYKYHVVIDGKHGTFLESELEIAI